MLDSGTKNATKGWATTLKLAWTKPSKNSTRFPTVFRAVYSGLRQFQVRRFPYGVYFQVIDETVVVVAVLHSRQDLKRLGKRIHHR